MYVMYQIKHEVNPLILEIALCLCGSSKKASHSINNLAFYHTIPIKLNESQIHEFPQLQQFHLIKKRKITLTHQLPLNHNLIHTL